MNVGMNKNKFVVIALAAVLALAPVRASAGVPIVPPVVGPVVATGGGSGSAIYGLVGCVASIMIAAAVASREFNRELTAAEAATCGLLFWINRANARRP